VKTILCAPACILLCACAGPGRPPQAADGASPVGAPASPVSAEAIDRAIPQERRPGPEAIRLPDRITLPAVYRLLLVDGHLTLVRETGAREFQAGPSSLRAIAGDADRGELSYQPALLPQELAAEVAAGRESSARMEAALESVMRRSRELSQQAMELEAQGKRLAELLASSEARVRQLEAEARPAAPRTVPESEIPRDPP
jgi:hypothetical protein